MAGLDFGSHLYDESWDFHVLILWGLERYVNDASDPLNCLLVEE